MRQWGVWTFATNKWKHIVRGLKQGNETQKTTVHFLDLAAVNSWFLYVRDAKENKLRRKNIGQVYQ